MFRGTDIQFTVGVGAAMGRRAARELPVDVTREADDIADRMQGAAAQTQTIIAGIVIGAALLIGFFIIDSIDGAAQVGNRTDSLDESKNDTLDRIGDGMLIGGVIIIVLFAAIILRVLRGL